MQDSEKITILVADYRVLVGNGIVTILEQIPDFLVVGQAKSAEEAFLALEQQHPDVLTIEIDLPNPVKGIEVLRTIRRTFPGVRIIVLTNLADEAVVQDVLRLGVTGYLLKNSTAEELVQAVRSAYQRRAVLSPEVTELLIHGLTVPKDFYLTPREHQVLDLIAQGRNNQEIAKALNISLSTVQFHVGNILDKLDVHNRIEAATFAVRHHLAKFPNAATGTVH